MMRYHTILFQSFVKPFYRDNAGAFIFCIILMFCLIGKVDGAELFEYHFSLVTGMLQNFSFLLLVLFAWLVYTRKFAVFVSKIIRHPQFAFLHVYNQLSKAKRWQLFFVVEVWLLLPVLLYSLFIFYVALGMHSYLPVAIIVVYLLLLASVAALRHVRLLEHGFITSVSISSSLFKGLNGPASYTNVLLQFIARKQLLVWSGIKLFTCGLLYFITRNNERSNYDISMPFIFYTFGILANGVLILRVRAFEDMYLSFYRGLAIPLSKRLLHYCFVYAVSLFPEIITVTSLSPAHLYLSDAVGFVLSGFSMLLFINSITFHDDFTMKEFLRILFFIFVVSSLCFTIINLFFLSLLLVSLSAVLFAKGYYQFEKEQNSR